LYAGTNELRAAERQRDKIAGQYGIDFSLVDTKSEDKSLLTEYAKAYENLTAEYNDYVEAHKLGDTAIQSKLRETAASVQKLGKKYAASMAEAERLEEAYANSGSFINKHGKEVDLGFKQQLSQEELDNVTASMRKYAEQMYGADLQNVKLNTRTMTLTGTLRQNNKVVSDVAVKFNQAKESLYGYQVQERESLTGIPAFIKGFKEKLKAISQYIASMTSIYQVIGQIRKGIQYIREIDAALVELRKVTDETEETYDEFLNTAAKTADRLGSTISAVTEATATFAKLGYTMEMAAEMAEAAIVYKNVGDGIASAEDAADSIISTLKGFRLEASESMRIVDRFNEVGNRFAITSQGLGEALRLSASALNEGGNTLDESIGIITAANEVVNDPSSVGTALKTLTLRLRGSKTELEEAGLDIENMATTTSQLQAKLLALTGGKVDIMLDANSFKSSTQILREMAAAWETMTDIQRASALELMGGKRQAKNCPNVQKCASANVSNCR
jgi:TP901 family phage tail tape measure protein